MVDGIKTLTIEGKTVEKLVINGKTVWEAFPDNVLLTADNQLFMTADDDYFVVKSGGND